MILILRDEVVRGTIHLDYLRNDHSHLIRKAPSALSQRLLCEGLKVFFRPVAVARHSL